MPENITMTERAAKQITAITADEPESAALRVSVSGGGCSGFQYEFGITNKRNNDDIVVERGGATALVDVLSLAYLDGSEIDYVDDLIGASFKINNPNAASSCGCGTSFSI
jgi:iron-sulfur cluster assembly accessory protein